MALNNTLLLAVFSLFPALALGDPSQGLRGDRLILSQFSLEIRDTGNILTFGKDPLISYIRYTLCKKDGPCLPEKSTIGAGFEIPPSLGQDPLVKIWACITESRALDPKKNCTPYGFSLGDIPQLSGERLSLLLEKEKLTDQVTTHGDLSFMALYRFLGRDKKTTTCSFKGLFPNQTLSVQAGDILRHNPYWLNESFGYMGFVTPELIQSTPQSALGLAEGEDGIPAPRQDWGQWIWSWGESAKAHLDAYNQFQLQQAADAERFYMDPLKNTYRIGSNLTRISGAVTASYQIMTDTPPAPARGYWESFSSAMSTIGAVPGYLRVGADQTEKIADQAEGLPILAQKIKFLMKGIQNEAEYLQGRYGEDSGEFKNFQEKWETFLEEYLSPKGANDLALLKSKLDEIAADPILPQSFRDQYNAYSKDIDKKAPQIVAFFTELKPKIAKLTEKYPFLKADPSTYTTVEFKKIVKMRADPEFKEVTAYLQKKMDDAGIPESYKEAYRSSLAFLGSDDYIKFEENILKMADFWDQHQGQFKKIGGTLLGMIQNTGALPTEFPDGWRGNVQIAAESLKWDRKKEVLAALDEINVHRQNPAYSPKVLKTLIDAEKAKIAKAFDETPPTAWTEELRGFEVRLLAYGATEPRETKTLQDLNQYFDLFFESMVSYTKNMTPEEFEVFKENHPQVVNALGGLKQTASSPIDMVSQGLERTKEAKEIFDAWPPKTGAQVQIITERLVGFFGTGYDVHPEKWDELYKVIVDNDSSPISPTRIALQKGLKAGLDVKNGADLYQYLFKIEPGKENMGLIQGLIYNEFEIQQKIDEISAREKGLTPEDLRAKAQEALWRANPDARNISTRMLLALQIPVQDKFIKGIVERMYRAYAPDGARDEILEGALKDWAARWARDLAQNPSTPNASPERLTLPDPMIDMSPSRSQSPRFGFLSKVVRGFHLTEKEADPLTQEFLWVQEEQAKLAQAQAFRQKGQEWVAMGLLASHYTEITRYQADHSQGDCGDLKQTARRMTQSEKAILDLQKEINTIEAKLSTLSRGE
jgi:hypothetical protein